MNKFLVFVLTMCLITFAAGNSVSLYDEIWNAILQKNKYSLLSNSNDLKYLTDKYADLKSGISIEFVPGFEKEIYSDNFTNTESIILNHPKYYANVQLMSSQEKIESGQINISYKLFTSVNKKTKIVAEQIKIKRNLIKLSCNQILLNDFKEILKNRIAVQSILYELRTRELVDKNMDIYYIKLLALEKEGIIASNSLTSILQFIKSNNLEIKALEIKKDILLNSLFNQYKIKKDVFLKINIKDLVVSLLPDTLNITYSEKIDSLYFLMDKNENKEQNLNEWSLSIGGGAKVYNRIGRNITLGNVNASLKYSIKRRVDENELVNYKVLRRPKKVNLDNKLKQFTNIVEEQNLNNKEMINKIFQKIYLGNHNAIYELVQNMNILLYSRLSNNELKLNYYQQKINEITSLDYLPKRFMHY